MKMDLRVALFALLLTGSCRPASAAEPTPARRSDLDQAAKADSIEDLQIALRHPDWSVRAKAAEAIGAIVNSQHVNVGLREVAEKALWGAVEDPDAVVAERALRGIRAELPAPDTLFRLADRHPQLLGQALEFVAGRPYRPETIYEDTFRNLLKHPSPTVRASVLGPLLTMDANSEKEIAEAMSAPESEVRIAAAQAIFRIANAQWYRPIPIDPESTVKVETKEAKEKAAKPAEPSAMRTLFTLALILAFPVEPDPRAAVAPAPTDSRIRYDDRLRQFAEGKGRSVWLSRMVPPLEQMARSDSEDERFHAAMALASLGRAEAAVSVLRHEVKTNTSRIELAAEILPWLPLELRQQFFDDLLALRPDASQLTAIASAVRNVPDPRPDSFAWTLITNERADIATVKEALCSISPPDPHPTDGRKNSESMRQFVAMLQQKATTGPELQRLAALVEICRTNVMMGIATADRMLDDPTLSRQLREDAFQATLLPQHPEDPPSVLNEIGVSLPTRPQPSAVLEAPLRRAVAALDLDDPGICKIALARLAMSMGQYIQFRNELFLWVAKDPEFDRAAAAVRAGLTREKLETARAKVDDEGKPYADYLLSMLGDRSALDRLIPYWREQRRDERDWKMNVARAIARTNDESDLPALEEIYSTIDSKRESDEFETAIQSMTVPAAKPLRKKNRMEWYWK